MTKPDHFYTDGAERKQLKIIAVALNYHGLVLSRPVRCDHEDIVRDFAASFQFAEGPDPADFEHGFISHTGAFLNRKEAWKLLTEDGKYQLSRKGVNQHNEELYSTDLR